MSFYREPVSGKNFFARDDILSQLVKSVNDIKLGYRRNIAITGRGLVGKTSLLLHFLGIASDDNNITPVYVNLKGKGLGEFVEDFISILFHHSLRKIKRVKGNRDISYLINSAKGPFPKSAYLAKRIRESIVEGNLNDAYSDLWDLCVIINSESGTFPVLVLDEFEHVADFGLYKPFQVLGQKIMVQQKTLFILSSSSTVTARKILSEELSLLFGGFKVIDIEPLMQKETRIFIERVCEKTKISDSLKDFLFAFTGGHPFYLDVILQRLNLLKEYGTERVSPKALGRILAELLFHRNGIINLFFTDMLDGLEASLRRSDIIDVVRAFLITGRVQDVVRTSKVPLKDVTLILNNLLDAGMISKSGSLYVVTDVVFRTWVELKSKPRNFSFDFLADENANGPAKDMESKISDFQAERRKSFDKKLVDLISSFKNNYFFIDERERILPVLKYDKQQDVNTGCTFITMQGKKRWLFVVSSNKVTEEALHTILHSINELKYDVGRIVLIVSSDIEDTAKLFAKQKSIWIWDREDLNRLFQFYKGYNVVIA